MNAETLTSQALTDELSVHDLEELLQEETLSQIEIAQRIRLINSEIASRIARQQKIDIDARLSDPESVDDLFLDPSYSSDSSFTPSVEDQQRLSNYEMRQYALQNSRNSIRGLRQTMEALGDLIENGASYVEALEQQIAKADSSWALKMFAGWVEDPRPALRSQIALLKERMRHAPEKFGKAFVALEHALESSVGLQEDEAYDPSLHADDTGRIGTLSREFQSVLVSFDGDSTFTLRMPRTFGEQDFVRVLKLEIRDSDDIDTFTQLLGREMPVDSGVFRTVEENVSRQYDFEDEVVPFPLDVVDLDGEQVYRLPKVVWERFGGYLS